MGTKLNDLNGASADVRDQLLRAALCPQGWGHDSVTMCVTTKVSAYNDALDRSEVTQLAHQAQPRTVWRCVKSESKEELQRDTLLCTACA